MLKIESLRKRYDDHIAVDGVDLEIKEGETVILTGPSGCGKSTVLRCINRLVEPDEGSIFYKSIPMHSLKYDRLLLLRRDIGFVFQHFNLIERLTSLQNVMMALLISGMNRIDAERYAKKALERVGLSKKLDKHPSEMSGGEKQRVGIARALATNPSLMLWDEPTASLDPILVMEVLDVMEDLIKESSTTMMIVTHEIAFARRVADRVLLMEKGRIVESGSPIDVFDNPASEIGKRYKRLIH